MAYRYPVYQAFIGEKEKEYVNECLDTTWISSKGRFVTAFENDFAQYIGCKHATTVSNGTVALHLALLALEIGAGDEVIVPTLTYIASVNAITYTGAKAVFADSLPNTWQIDPASIVSKITSKTKAIMAVHLFGHPCDMVTINAIAKQYNLLVIEDCAEALGSTINGIKMGMFSNIATFSFYGNKTITTGEGGMVVTNDSTIFDLAVRLKGQGLAPNKQYWHDLIGYNYRMTNICAAIGYAQLQRIEHILAEKTRVAELYKEALEKLSITFHLPHGNIFHSYWMITILTAKPEERDALRQHLELQGIETRPVFYPVHTLPIYFSNEHYPVAENIASRGINLPSYPQLSKQDIQTIAQCVASFYK